MTEELKARIAQINAGTAPAGYKKTKVGIVPEEWGICHFKKQFARLRRKNTEGNTNVLTISAQYGLINQEEFFKKEVASEDKSNYYLLFRGDFAYNKSYSNGYPFGAFKMLDRYDSGVVSPLYICFTPTESNECPAFYVQYFENGMMNREIQAVAQEGARNHGLLNISIDDFFNSYLLCPPLPEQQKIAEILTAQDAVIALMQKQIELLQKQKKAFLQKMFPKKGCNVPKIRFAGFTDAWEQRKLGDVASNFEYGLNASAKEFDGENKYIRITDIDDESRVFLSDDITSPDTDLTSADKYKLEKGDILFARTGASVGKTYLYREKDGLVYYAGFLIRAKINPENDAEFVFQNTLTDSYDSFIRITSQRSGQPGVNAQEYQGFSFYVPSLKEQQLIGTYFKNLDTLITFHQRKLEFEQQKKKALMQLLLTGKVRVKT